MQFFVGGGPRIELIEPAAVDSPIRDILRRGSKFYHIAYEVAHLHEAINSFEKLRYIQIGPAAPAAAFNLRRIVFMSSETGTLVELIELPSS